MGIRVLVVDDDKDLLTLIDRFLVKEQPDFEVISTISAQDAVRKLEEEHFDAIVCDYYLGVGEMNGLELLEWLRASNSTIPFIMFTGRSREEVAIRALNLGADLYLKKDQEDLGNLFVELVHHIKSSVESVQMQKTLWEERSRFQKYLDVARVMILALDSDGTVTLVNRRGCEILGYDLDEIIGKDWFKTFLPKRLRKETYDLFRSLTKGKVGPAGYSENLVLTKDGEERIIAWYYTVLTDESGMITGTLSSGEDITERKRAEEALRQSKQRYYDLLMTLPEGVGITDLDENFTYVNKALSDMLDYTVEELVQKNVLNLTPADGRRKIKAETERRKRNGISTYELQMIRKDGELVLLEVSTLPQKDNQGNVIGTIGVTSNITKRKQAEEALRDSESMFRSLFEQAPMGVARVGLDGAILQGNSSLALMLGYDTDELVGINVFDISTPEDEKIERRFSQELLQGTRDSYKMERRFIRKDGDQIWGILSVSVVSNSRGEPIFTIRMVENITPRKKAEEALRVSEKRFRTVFEQAAVGVSIVELDDNIIEANPFFQELIGYSADELVTMKVADFAHPDDTAIDASLMREVLDGKRDSYTMEKRYIRKTGEEIRGNFSANFVKNEEGIPEFCIGIIEDITERKKAEDKIRESEVRFRGLFEKSPIGVELYDLEGQLIDANQATLDIFGVSSVDEVKGFKLFEDPNVTDELKNRVRRGESVTYQTEFCFEKVRELDLYETSKSGTTHIDVMISPMILGGGDQTDAYIVHVRDISETRMAQDAVEKSEEQYRSLFENMLNGCAYCKILADDQGKPIDFIYLDINDSFEKLTGLKRNDIVGKRVTEAIPRIKEETPELFDIYGSVAQTGEPAEFEIDFSPLDIRLKITVISPKRGYFVAIFDNITERKKAEEKLGESEQRNRIIVDAMSDLVLVFDSAGRYSDLFAKDDSLLVRPWNEMKGRKHEEILPPDLAARYNEYGKKVRETGESVTFEYELEIGSTLRWFQGTMMLHEDEVHIVYAVKDITERKLAEVNLRLSENKYHSIFDNTPVGLTFQEIVVDESGNPIDFVFIDVNEGFEALMGLRKDDIIGKSASHVLTSSGEPTLEWIDVYGKVALTGARARFDQYSEALGRWFSVTAYSPEKNFFITAYTDITEQKKGYENLKQQKKELSDFAHMMSHDLSSYFFKVRGSILLLGSNDEFPEIRGIKLLTEEMIDLVQHSVALADAGLVIDKKHKVNLDHLVRDIAMRYLPEGIALMQGPLQSVMADEIKLIQIFQNLFDNAIEHGSPTTVEVQRYDSKEGVRIVVANDGKSIPIDSRPKVFQRGFTTKDKRKGYGLSIVKKLVEAHGWQIKLVDTPETAFEILIPSAAG